MEASGNAKEKFYKIDEFARLLGVSATTLRNWDKRGILKPDHKTPTGYRIYSDKQLKELLWKGGS